ncbi:hypothetical protein PMAYCL1PPCAC_17649, partial [Pristionchus mayeri]
SSFCSHSSLFQRVDLFYPDHPLVPLAKYACQSSSFYLCVYSDRPWQSSSHFPSSIVFVGLPSPSNRPEK